MCLHRSLIYYVCYMLSKDFRYCVKSIQFRVRLVVVYITILVINNENLVARQIIFQPPLTGVRTPSTLILSHERFLVAICLHGICMELICYVCYIFSEDYRCCVRSIQFRFKLVAGCITILMINIENLLPSQILILQFSSFLIKRWHFVKLKWNFFVKKYFK